MAYLSARNYTKIQIRGFFGARSHLLLDKSGTFITDILGTRLPVAVCGLPIQVACAKLILLQVAVSQVTASPGMKW